LGRRSGSANGSVAVRPTGSSPALNDPLAAVVDHVIALESGLDRRVLTAVVEVVAPGRTRRQRLAQALSEQPAVLRHGRAPAPRVVADLLIALRKAGAVNISAPRCSGCSKELSSTRHRGQDWYCGVCGPRREPCAGCGRTLAVSCRDRDGRAHCVNCPPDEQDPLAIIVAVVHAVAPTIPTQTVADAVLAVTPRAGARRRLAWALGEQPDLLTGNGAQAPVPTVLTLIDLLHPGSAGSIVRPPCPHCGRVITLRQLRDGLRLCRNCVAKSRAVPCGRCGARSEPATRDPGGSPVCGWCLSKEPATHEICAGCGRLRAVHVRTGQGPLCDSCRPQVIGTCGICGRTAPCMTSAVTGQPWCEACRQRWTRCVGCDQVKPVRGGTHAEPLCATCTRPDPSFWRPCPGCGDRTRQRGGPCQRCTLKTRLQKLLSDHTGQIRPELQTLAETLATHERPTSVMRWLDLNKAHTTLQNLAAGELPLTHHALDELPDSLHVQHLRTVLVATDVLPARDEHLIRLERWIAITIAGQPDSADQYLLHRYSDWYLIRRLRARIKNGQTSHHQIVAVQQRVRAAISFLDALAAQDLTLSTATQPDLDTWLTSANVTRRHETGYFIRWATTQKLATLSFPAVAWNGPGPIDAQARWDQARQLLHDDTLKPQDRVAGLLILLYAQEPATIARLTLQDVQASNGQTRLRLGPEPVLLPEPLDALVLTLVAARHPAGRVVTGDRGTSTWLFPGGRPGQPISPQQLRARLSQLDIRPATARTAALFHLATELPAALLARMLGITVAVAARWQQVSAGDWTSYAADVAQRPTQ
jgi:hypothetical protein